MPDIMYVDGPDRHTDGSDVITDFIVALMEGRAEQWHDDYRKRYDLLTD